MLFSLFATVAFSECTTKDDLMALDNIYTAKNTCEWGGECVFVQDQSDFENPDWKCWKKRGTCNNKKGMQCGGHSFIGQECCAEGTECFKRDHQFSSCKPSCPQGKDWDCEGDDATESDYHCVGEISSKNEECAEKMTQEDCEAYGVSIFSDGVCDWKMYADDDRAKTMVLVEASMWDQNPCDESYDSSWVTCEKYASCALMDCSDKVTAKNPNWRRNKSGMLFNDVCDTNDCVPDPCECKDEFHWDGTKYDECAVTEADGHSWCYVKGGAACEEATESTKNEGMFYIENCGHDCDCKEFFLYGGKAHTECTDMDDTKPWCHVKGYDDCEHATEDKVGQYKRYCPTKGCPSQMEIDELPAMSARNLCEAAGCVYTTDTSNPFKTKRMCNKESEESKCTDDETMKGFDNVHTAKNTCEWTAGCVFIHDQMDFENPKMSCKKKRGACNNMDGMQCGGHTFEGQECCSAGLECFKRDHQYSGCVASCPQGWDCDEDDDTTEPPVDDDCACKDEFYWKGTKYTECAITEEGGKSWCYVKGGANCDAATESTKFEGMFYIENCGHDCDCKDQFQWKGVTYTECTDVDSNDGPWCFVKGGSDCQSAIDSLFNLGESYKYCEVDDGCPSQVKIDELPAMSARTVCEQAGCTYSTDTSDPFNTKRICKKETTESKCTDDETMKGFDNVHTAKNTCEWDAGCVFIQDRSDFENETWRCEEARGTCNNMDGMQCGGHSFEGQECCSEGLECFKRDHQYSGCLAECPNGWECDDDDDTTEPPVDDDCECKDEFYWKGTKYTECALTEEGGVSWCYVKGGANCEEATESTKFEGMFYIEKCGHGCDCKDEFSWKGVTYTECTEEDSDKGPWCYVKGECESAEQSNWSDEKYKYCKVDDGCPSQMKIDELPAMSAKTTCEQAGCVYTTDTSNPFETKRMCKPKSDDGDECKGDDDDDYVNKLFNFDFSGVDDCMSAVRFLELQALGTESEGCDIPLADYVAFGILTMDPKYETLREVCCNSCELLPEVCTLDADTYRPAKGELCARGEESFTLYCDELNCISNSECSVEDFDLDDEMFECDQCEKGDRDTYAGKLFNFAMSGVDDCMSAVRFLELQAMGDDSEGCDIPLANMAPFMIFNMDPKYETLRDMCCESCKRYPDLCTIDADSYVSEDGLCARGEESFTLYCGEVNCISNSECSVEDFDLDDEMFECDECLMEDTLWKGSVAKKSKADSITECYEKCADSKGMPEGKTCKAYSYLEGAKKSCRLFAKNKKTKSKSLVVSGKRNCHPTKGKIKN